MLLSLIVISNLIGDYFVGVFGCYVHECLRGYLFYIVVY